MKLYFILLLGFLGAVVPVRAQEPPAQDCEIVALPSGGRIVRWLGYPGRTYFMQVSSQAEPLANWTWMPIIESGSGEEISYEIDGTASRAFFRLQYTDQVSANPDLSDFDQDGLSNAQELQQQTDPFDPDTDDDGLGDGWEFLAGSDPRDNGTVNFASGPNGDTDGDGATNAAEAAAGTDANQAGSFPPRVEWHRRYGEIYFSAGWGGNQFDSVAGYGSPQTITHPLSGSPLASTAVASMLASDHPFPPDATGPTGRQQLFPSLDVEAHGTYHYSEINPDTGESYGAHAFLSQTRIWLKLPDTSTSQNPRKFPLPHGKAYRLGRWQCSYPAIINSQLGRIHYFPQCHDFEHRGPCTRISQPPTRSAV